MATKNKPKHDGSGKGVRANKGRSGCKKTKSIGQGRRRWNKNATIKFLWFKKEKEIYYW